MTERTRLFAFSETPWDTASRPSCIRRIRGYGSCCPLCSIRRAGCGNGFAQDAGDGNGRASVTIL